MNAYDQTKKIIDELGLKAISSPPTQSKKVFLVVLEGTEAEFDELKSMGAVEIKDTSLLDKLYGSIPSQINSRNICNTFTTEENILCNKENRDSQYICEGPVVTEKDVLKLPKMIKEIVLQERGIITPLARDLAKQRGIIIRKHQSSVQRR